MVFWDKDVIGSWQETYKSILCKSCANKKAAMKLFHNCLTTRLPLLDLNQRPSD